MVMAMDMAVTAIQTEADPTYGNDHGYSYACQGRPEAEPSYGYGTAVTAIYSDEQVSNSGKEFDHN